jgi:AcrR family transcriptional regulator
MSTAGRPRSGAADEAIRTAALDLLVERGAGEASIEQVARRAGVTRATVYRRYPDRTALLVQAVEWAHRDLAAMDWPDVEAMVAEWAGYLSSPRNRRLMRRLYGAVDDLPELLRAYGRTHGHARAEAVRATLDKARAAGELPAGVDVAVLQETLSGAALQHLGAHPDTSGRDEVGAYLLAVLALAGYRKEARA